MLVLTALTQVPADFGPTAVTLGNFDGVHRGHSAVLAEVVEHARRGGLKAVAITFHPHPIAVLHPERAPVQITAMEDRLALLEQTGLDAVIVMPFTWELAQQTPEEFVKSAFVDGLRAAVVLVGQDTRFGVRNSGDIGTLRALGARFGFEVVTLADVGEGQRWSSTQVRGLLAEGEVAHAAQVLGRAHRVRGTVVRGLRRGRELGYPTANLSQDARGMIPGDGVYAGWLVRHDLAHDAAEHRMPAAISVGTNPTFGNRERTVEAYVLDRTDLDLYDETVSVEFVHRLRGNTKFEDVSELVVQMHRDVDQARRLLVESH